MDENRKKLYDQLSATYDMGTFDEFDTDLDNEDNQKVAWEAMGGQDGYGDFAMFQQAIQRSPQAAEAGTTGSAGKTGTTGSADAATMDAAAAEPLQPRDNRTATEIQHPTTPKDQPTGDEEIVNEPGGAAVVPEGDKETVDTDVVEPVRYDFTGKDEDGAIEMINSLDDDSKRFNAYYDYSEQNMRRGQQQAATSIATARPMQQSMTAPSWSGRYNTLVQEVSDGAGDMTSPLKRGMERHYDRYNQNIDHARGMTDEQLRTRIDQLMAADYGREGDEMRAVDVVPLVQELMARQNGGHAQTVGERIADEYLSSHPELAEEYRKWQRSEAGYDSNTFEATPLTLIDMVKKEIDRRVKVANRLDAQRNIIPTDPVTERSNAVSRGVDITSAYNITDALRSAERVYGTNRFESYVVAFAAKHNMTVPQARERVRELVTMSVAQDIIGALEPSSNAEYVLRKALTDNMVMNLARAGMTLASGAKPGDVGLFDMEDKAMAHYEQTHTSGWDQFMQVVATTSSFVVEGLGGGGFVLPGIVGKVVSNAAMKTLSRAGGGLFWKRLVSGSLGGAANFGVFESQMEAVRQLKTGERNPDAVWHSLVSGLAKGAGFGAVGESIGRLFWHSRGWMVPVGEVVKLAGETATFSAIGYLETGQLTPKDWATNFGMSLGGKLTHPVQYIADVKKRMDGGFGLKVQSISGAYRDELTQKGYGTLAKVLHDGVLAQEDIGRVRDELSRMRSDNDVPMQTLQLAEFALNGRVLPCAPATGYRSTHQADGTWTLTPLDPSGRPLGESITVKGTDAKNAAEREMKRQIEKNAVTLSEYSSRGADVTRAVGKAVMSYCDTSGEDPMAVYSVYQEALRKSGNNESLGEVERQILDAVGRRLDGTTRIDNGIESYKRTSREAGYDIDKILDKPVAERTAGERKALDEYKTWLGDREEQAHSDNIADFAEWVQRSDEAAASNSARIAREYEQRAEELRGHVEELRGRLDMGNVVVLENIDQVEDAGVRRQIEQAERKGERGVPGWYDESTDTTYVYLPHAESIEDLDRTIMHEQVTHHGLRVLKTQGYNDLCDRVWNSMSDAERDRWENYPGVKGIDDQTKRQRAAADEYIANLAERTDPESAGLWSRFVAWAKEGMRSLGIRTDRISDAELEQIIRESYRNLREQRGEQAERVAEGEPEHIHEDKPDDGAVPPDDGGTPPAEGVAAPPAADGGETPAGGEPPVERPTAAVGRVEGNAADLEDWRELMTLDPDELDSSQVAEGLSLLEAEREQAHRYANGELAEEPSNWEYWAARDGLSAPENPGGTPPVGGGGEPPVDGGATPPAGGEPPAGPERPVLSDKPLNELTAEELDGEITRLMEYFDGGGQDADGSLDRRLSELYAEQSRREEEVKEPSGPQLPERPQLSDADPANMSDTDIAAEIETLSGYLNDARTPYDRQLVERRHALYTEQDRRSERAAGTPVEVLRGEFSEQIGKSKHGVELDETSIDDGEMELTGRIKVDGEDSNVVLVHGEGDTPDSHWNYASVTLPGKDYEELSRLAGEFNRIKGRDVAREDPDALRINFTDIDDAIEFDRWTGEHEQEAGYSVREGETFEEYEKRVDNPYKPDSTAALYVKNKYADRWDEITRIVQGITPENAESVGRELSKIIERDDAGKVLSTVNRGHVNPLTVLPFIDGVSKGLKDNSTQSASQPQESEAGPEQRSGEVAAQVDEEAERRAAQEADPYYMPMENKGGGRMSPNWRKATAEQIFNHLNDRENESGRDTLDGNIADGVKRAEDKLKAVERREPKGKGRSDAALDKWEKELSEARTQLEKWREVERMRREQKAADGDDSDPTWKQAYDEFNSSDEEPVNLEDYVARHLYGTKFKWKDKEFENTGGRTHGLGGHLGLSKSDKERRGFFGWIDEKNGSYPESVAEGLYANMPDWMRERYDTMEVLDAVLSVVGSNPRPRDMVVDYVKRLREQNRDMDEYYADEAAGARGFHDAGEMDAYDNMREREAAGFHDVAAAGREADGARADLIADARARLADPNASEYEKQAARTVLRYRQRDGRDGVTAQGAEGDGMRYRIRTKEPPKKTRKVYKLMRLGEDGKLYPLFIDSASPVELGTWYDADSPNLDFLKTLTAGVHLVNAETGESMTLEQFSSEHPELKIRGSNPNAAAIDWATANGMRWMKVVSKDRGQRRYGGELRSYYNYGINGSGAVETYALRPGWHAGSLPTMRQIGKGPNKNLRDNRFVWVEGEVAADVDYQGEADANPDKDIPDRIPEDGYYLKATNADKAKSQADRVGWFVSGAFKANRIISDAEARRVIDQWNAEHPGQKVEYDYERESGVEFSEEDAARVNGEATESGGVRFRYRDEERRPTFYSNAERAVENVKQGKATAEQWKAMLTKAGGIKAGEDKWMGLTDWLDEHKGQSLTKDEVLQFVRDNGIRMEEVNYGGDEQDRWRRIWDNLSWSELYDTAVRRVEERGGDSEEWDNINDEIQDILTERYGEQVFDHIDYDSEGNIELKGNEIHSIREDRTTPGLENKREIAFVVPGIEPYQEGDAVHFGPENKGRAVMWVRFGETRDTDGKRVLVIDEVQSNRHQDARKRGYITKEQKDADKALKEYISELKEKYGIRYYNQLSPQERLKFNQLTDSANDIARGGIPAAPFEKNWMEVAMKRMLRLAAEEGFDKVAWTTGAQQAERYDLGDVVKSIKATDGFPSGFKEIDIELNNDTGSTSSIRVAKNNGEIVRTGSTFTSDWKGKNLRDVVGKEMAERLLADGQVNIRGEALRIGGEGMKGFYDQIVPGFMRKYVKKWGSQVGEVELATPGGEVMHSVDVTEPMKESVMQGQPLFRVRGEHETGDRVRVRREGMNDGRVRVDGLPGEWRNIDEAGRAMQLSDPEHMYVPSDDGKWLDVYDWRDNEVWNIWRGKPGSKRYEKWRERTLNHIHKQVPEYAKKLGLDVELIDNEADVPAGHENEKSWYDAETGKIHIVVPRHAAFDVSDVMSSLWHEGVSRHGLRKLVGDDNYDTFLDNVYATSDANIRAEIDRLTEEVTDGDRRGATEEYLSRLAEQMGFQYYKDGSVPVRSWMQRGLKVMRENFDKLCRHLGMLDVTETLRDDDLRAVLYDSYHHLLDENRDAYAAAKRAEREDKEYVKAVKRGDIDTAMTMLHRKLAASEGIVGYAAAHGHGGNHREVSHRLKDSESGAIEQAARDMAQYVPKDAVLVPMPPHEGVVRKDTDTWLLAQELSRLTGAPVVAALRGRERESRYAAKQAGRKGLSADELGFYQDMELPDGKTPVFVDNVVGSGETAKAAVQAMGGRGMTLAYTKGNLGKPTEGLKNVTVTYDDAGNLIPLSERFDRSNSDVRFRFVGERGAGRQDAADGGERMRNKEIAEAMERGGKDARAIKLATGWERGKDGKWRHEERDFDLYQYPDAERRDLEDIISEDDSLFDAYPELRDYGVLARDLGYDTGGSFNASTKTITINSRLLPKDNDIYSVKLEKNKQIRDSILHEVQHAIQSLEGFAKGGAVARQIDIDYTRDRLKSEIERLERMLESDQERIERARELIRRSDEAIAKNPHDKRYVKAEREATRWEREGLPLWEANQRDMERELEMKKAKLSEVEGMTPTEFDEYRRLAGEVEARNVSKRMNMTDEQRRGSLASDTEDVARDEQIVRYGGGVSMDEGDINDAISRAKRDAERMPEPIEFTKENWDKAFPAGKVTTPIGEVSLGAHQFDKMQSKGRTAEVGLMKATLERPDFVIEENAPNESAERQSNYLFVKTFVKGDGTTYRHYESVTISRDGGEVVVSSHYISENKLRSVLKDGNLIYKKEDSQSSNGSEMRLAETQSGRSDLLPTPDDNESHSGKGSENSADGQADGGETTNFRVRDGRHWSDGIEGLQGEHSGHEGAVEEARRRLESDDASEFERTAARAVIKAYGGGSGDTPDTPGGGVRFRTRDDADMLVDMTKHNNEVARQRRDAVTDFVKAITDVDELTDSKFATALGKVMRGQRQYDQDTVADITTMVKAMMDAGLLTELDNFSVKQILTKVKDSTGKNDITAEANKLIDIMLKHQLRRGKRAFEQQLKVKGMRQDSRGVVVQGGLDYHGQRAAKALKEGLSLGDLQAVNDRIDEAEQRLSDPDEVVRGNAADELEGLYIARQYYDEIKQSEINEANIKSQLEQAQADHKNGTLSDEAYKQLRQASNDALRELRCERVDAWARLNEQLSGSQSESAERAKQFREQQKQRQAEIQHWANSDMEGHSADPHEQETRKKSAGDKARDVAQAVLQPLGTFDKLMRYFGNSHPKGEGYLFGFMRRFMNVRDQWFKERKADFDQMDTAARRIGAAHGARVKVKLKDGTIAPHAIRDWADVYTYINQQKPLTVTVKGKDYEITQGNATYLLAMEGQADGRMKLRSMGLTEADMDALRGQVDPMLLELSQWVIHGLLPSMRPRLNATHLRMFGADMTDIPNYFPIRTSELARNETVNLAQQNGKIRPATITGSIIERKRNNLDLDLGADFFQVTAEHVDEMNHWNSFAEFARDLNTLLSYKRFKAQVHNLHSWRYGNGADIWQTLETTAGITTGDYLGKTSKADAIINGATKGLAAANITFRPYTGLKQLLSSPVYLVQARWDDIGYSLADPKGTWQWAIKDLPTFAERWQGRMAGDPILTQAEQERGSQNKKLRTLSKWGFAFNAAVDAVTVAIGARAIYRTKYRRYKNMGYSDEQANQKALEDAAISVNETQQSGLGAFTSVIQQDRTFWSRALTIFRNASMGYQRQLVEGLKAMRNGLSAEWRATAREKVQKKLERDGIDSAMAAKVADRLANREAVRGLALATMFGSIAPFVWALGMQYLGYKMAGGDDDEQEGKMLWQASTHLLSGWVEGIVFGGQLSSAADFAYDYYHGRKKLRDYSLQRDLVSDMAEQILGKSSGKPADAVYDIVNMLVAMGTGVNPKSIVEPTVGIIDVVQNWGGDAKLAHEVALGWCRLLNVPQTSLDQVYIDEIGLSAKDAKQLSAEEFAERWCRYKRRRGAGWMSALTSDESDAEQEGKLLKRYERMMDERFESLSDERVEQIMRESDDELLKKHAAKAYKSRIDALTDDEVQAAIVQLSDSAPQDSIATKREGIKRAYKSEGMSYDTPSDREKNAQAYERRATMTDIAEDAALKGRRDALKNSVGDEFEKMGAEYKKGSGGWGWYIPDAAKSRADEIHAYKKAHEAELDEYGILSWWFGSSKGSSGYIKKGFTDGKHDADEVMKEYREARKRVLAKTRQR